MKTTVRRLRSRITRLHTRPEFSSLGGYLERWLDLCQMRGLRPGTVASYRATLFLNVPDDLLRTGLNRVTPRAVNEMYAFLLTQGRKRRSGGLSPRTVRYVHTLLNRAYADAVRMGYVRTNPVELADPPSVRSTRPRVRTPWSSAELRTFLAAAKDDPLFPAYYLAAFTGLRRGEVLGLRWSDVDLQDQALRVVQTIVEVGHELTVSEPKSDRSRRWLALDSRTIEVLRHHRGAEERRRSDDLRQAHALVFAQADGTPIHPACFSYFFSHRVKVVGSRQISFHDLRHGHATMALEAGIHPKVVSERLGHSTVSVTLDIYSHAIPSLQREAAERVAGLMDRCAAST